MSPLIQTGVNYFLIIALVGCLLLILLLLRQKLSTLPQKIFIYLNVLLLTDIFFAILCFNSKDSDTVLLATKVKIIIFLFLLSGLYHLSHSYKISPGLPRLSLKNLSFLGLASLISLFTLLDFIVIDVHWKGEMPRPIFSKYYWVVIFFFGFTAYFIFIDIIKKYRFSQRKEEISLIREILATIIPLATIVVAGVYVLPFWNISSPFFNVGYFVFMVLFFYSALRFQILEMDETVQQLLPNFVLVALFYAAFNLIHSHPMPIGWLLLSIPVFLLVLAISYLISTYLTRTIERVRVQRGEQIDKKLEEFSSGISRFITKEELWQFLTQFVRETFEFTKTAIITMKYDVSPYQIEFVEGFEKEKLDNLFHQTQSPLLDLIETNRSIINRYSFDPESLIFKTMESLNIYLVVPILFQEKMLGMILLGGSRNHAKITPRYLHAVRLMVSQLAVAVNNIEVLQKNLQAQKMSEIGMMASQLAHDFQSFITLAKMGNGVDERLRQQANYMEKYVKDLLNYARPQDLRLTPANINNLLDMSLDLVNIPPHIFLEKHYSNSLPQIHVDVPQMRRVFVNLFENSIRAMENQPEGRLKITTRPLRPISRVQRNPWIYIEILDDGCGIPEEFLDRIFDPFFTTNKSRGGTGLGLAIVKQIIEQHRGFIDVTSKPGKGTIFSIRLPYLME